MVDALNKNFKFYTCDVCQHEIKIKKSIWMLFIIRCPHCTARYKHQELPQYQKAANMRVLPLIICQIIMMTTLLLLPENRQFDLENISIMSVSLCLSLLIALLFDYVYPLPRHRDFQLSLIWKPQQVPLKWNQRSIFHLAIFIIATFGIISLVTLLEMLDRQSF